MKSPKQALKELEIESTRVESGELTFLHREDNAKMEIELPVQPMLSGLAITVVTLFTIFIIANLTGLWRR